jgi:hypothetical protein
MAELGIAPHIIEAVLNHQSGHKASVYKVREALTIWAKHIAELVRPANRRKGDKGRGSDVAFRCPDWAVPWLCSA